MKTKSQKEIVHCVQQIPRYIPSSQTPGTKYTGPVLSELAARQPIFHEKRSPFRLRYGVSLSYLLFSATRSDSVAGACLVGAGSLLASWLGEPALSVLAGVPLAVAAVAVEVWPPEYSNDLISYFFRRASSSFALRSALISFLAK